MNGRSPFTKSEWAEALAALRAETDRRRGKLPAQAEQAEIVRSTVLALRQAEADARATPASPTQLSIPEPVGRGR